jgi:DNA primase
MISEEEISQVRSATDLVSLIGERVVLRQRRNEFWGCCPFHNEKTPSFKVDPSSQFYYCFGCGESGDVFTYTRKTENVDFPDAVRLLAQRANIELAEDAQTGGQGRKARLFAVSDATAEFYHRQLMRGRSEQADAARAYLAQRGLGGEAPRRWQLGFAPGDGQLVRHLRSLGYTAQEMADADVTRRPSGGGGPNPLTDRFYARIMFPIHDLQGRTIAFGGRVFLPDDPSPAKYLNSSETLLFKKRETLYAIDLAKAAIVSRAYAIVVEGYTDTIALHQAGFENTVATLGTALTAQHLKLLARFCERVVLLFDGDEAGQRAADRALELIESALAPTAADSRRADIYVALLPGAVDPADFVAAQGAEALQAALDTAVPLLRHGLDRCLARYDLGQTEQVNRAEAAALQLLSPLKGTALAGEYLDYLVIRLGYLGDTQETGLRQRFEQLAPAGRRSAAQPPPDTQPPATQPTGLGSQTQAQRLQGFERELLLLYIEHPQLRDQLKATMENAYWSNEAHHSMSGELLRMNDGAARPSAQESLAVLTARLPEAAATLSAARLSEFNQVEPARLAERLLFSIREAKLVMAINRINGERRLLPQDDPQHLELFRQLAPLQQELAELRKRSRE